jgi:hypothetical protein
MQNENDKRQCPHKDHDGKPCSGTQTFTLAKRFNVAGNETSLGSKGNNMKTQARWDGNQESPEHFDEVAP